MPRLNVVDQMVGKSKSDALVVLAVQDGDAAQVAATPALPQEAREHIDANLLTLAATGAADEIIRLAGVPGVDGTVVVTGSGVQGMPSADDGEALRRAAGAAVRALRAKAGSVTVAFPASAPADVVATCEGALFGAYEFTSYKSDKRQRKPIAKITVLSELAKDKAVRAGVKQAQVVAEQRAWAQDLVNTPPLDLYPESFATAVKEHFTGSKVKVKVLDDKALAKESCGGHIGVGRGSARPPRMAVLTYRPARAKSHVAFVGKGITFDSGGLCIKPAEGMITMKCDMAGAAAVAAATAAIAELGLPVAVTTYLCLAENLTGADAQRPGDVVTMPNGRTVEIINTDAEGRLVMADGLALASREGPDLVVDVATLTGAAVLSLGTRTAAAMSNDDAVRSEVLTAADAAGEDLWPIPLLQHLRSGMKSLVADTKHTGARQGGMIIAALFLQDFVGDDADGKQLPWVHLDIAGPAYSSDDSYGYVDKGASGYGVRTLVQLARARS